jgi:hypothetical protein
MWCARSGKRVERSCRFVRVRGPRMTHTVAFVRLCLLATSEQPRHRFLCRSGPGRYCDGRHGKNNPDGRRMNTSKSPRGESGGCYNRDHIATLEAWKFEVV